MTSVMTGPRQSILLFGRHEIHLPARYGDGKEGGGQPSGFRCLLDRRQFLATAETYIGSLVFRRGITSQAVATAVALAPHLHDRQR